MSATRGLGQIAPEVHAGQVEVRLVGAADEIGHHGDSAVGDHLDWPGCRPGRCSRACSRGVVFDLGVGRKAEAVEPGSLPAFTSFN
jgi:hypothetical protein